MNMRTISMYLTLTVLLFAIMTASAFADTYNFYFDKKKKSPDNAEAIAPPQAENSIEDSADSYSRPLPKEPQPVIINNNISTPRSPEYLEPTPNVPTQTSVSSYSSTPPYSVESEKRLKWSIGTSFLVWAGRERVADLADPSTYTDITANQILQGVGAAAAVSLGYRILPGLGVSGYVGNASRGRAFVGADVEWWPLRLDVGRFDLLELALLGGASDTIAFSGYGSPAVLPHLGTRLNLNLGPSFTLTASVRLNRQASIGELGVGIHL